MKLSTGVRLLRVLNTRPENALTTEDIACKWRALGGKEVSRRSLERYMQDLSYDRDGEVALLETVKVGRANAYYVKPSQVANWFMTEDAALNLQLTHQVLERSFGTKRSSDGQNLADLAERITAASPVTKRIRECLRIVPDGIGRLPAQIDPTVLKAATDAIGMSKNLAFSYVDPAGRASERTLSPLGLVAKDGTIYLVAVKAPNDLPFHFALHRMTKAAVTSHRSQSRDDFDLDRHIDDTHQFSHALGDKAPEILKLRVAPIALFHFTERPLSGDQAIANPKAPGEWYVVTAKVPDTFLLVPFLVGMGPSIEVLEPAAIRAKTAQWLRESAAHYAVDAQAI